NEEHILETATDAPAEEMAVAIAVAQEKIVRAPMLSNYLFSALAGTTWYMQFFFYTMGETQMGRYKFSSWTLHMASIIIFSTLWGIALKEWKGAGGLTKSAPKVASEESSLDDNPLTATAPATSPSFQIGMPPPQPTNLGSP